MKLFGTDGIRGTFGRPPIDDLTLGDLARELGDGLRQKSASPVVVMGGDTRISTPEIAAWLIEGLQTTGCEVRWAGVLPTPGVACLARLLQADCGISISASHNPWSDNGVKLIDSAGFKWDSEAERSLERRLAARAKGQRPQRREPGAADVSLQDLYVAELRASLPSGQPLSSLSVALDMANGAASPYAGKLFEELGATVHAFHHRPNGRNINVDCGSNHADEIARRTVETGSDMGIAFDGDADRLVVADANGRILDGDLLLFLWARDLKRRGELGKSMIAVTEMSNLGLDECLARDEIDIVRCDVGDRAVVESMRERSLTLGGEQSGHLIHLGLSTTGDGMLSGLQLARLAKRRPLSEQAADFTTYPQLLRNVEVSTKPEIGGIPGLARVLADIERRLQGKGRVLLRYSGTEPLARIMIEGKERSQIEGMADEIESVIQRQIGTGNG